MSRKYSRELAPLTLTATSWTDAAEAKAENESRSSAAALRVEPSMLAWGKVGVCREGQGARVIDNYV